MNIKKRFQALLRDIPKWNQSILNDETQRVLRDIPFFMKCITAILVISIRILGSVRVKKDTIPLQVKIPVPEIIIHNIYIKSAFNIYSTKAVLDAFETYYEKQSNDLISYVISESIKESLFSMIPIQVILDEYLGDTFSRHVKDNPKEPEPENLHSAPLTLQILFQIKPYLKSTRTIS